MSREGEQETRSRMQGTRPPTLRPATGILLVLALAYAVWFSYLAVLRYETLNARGYDLGNVDQAVWNTAHGRPLEFTNWIGKSDDFRYPSRLAMHVEPIYFLLAPLYWLWSDVRILLILQATVVALGAPGVYRLATLQTGQPWAGVALAAAYLLNPPLQWALLDDFHAVTLVAGLLPFAFLALRQQRWGWLAVLALLILATKEDMPLVVGMMGVYALLWERQPRVGIALIVVAAVWFAVSFFVVIPRYTLGGQSQFVSRYTDVLGPGGLTLTNAPALVVATARALLDWETARYVVGLLWPLGFIPLLGWPALLPALPSLAINLLSNNPTQHVLGRHYVAPIVPVLFIAAARGLAGPTWGTLRFWGKRLPRAGFEAFAGHVRRIARPLKGLGPKASPQSEGDLSAWPQHLARLTAGRAPLGLTGLALLLSLVAQWHNGFTPLARDYEPPQVTAHHRLLARFLAQIPADASVSTQQNLNPHLTQRRRITIIPYDVSGEYLLLDVVTYPGYNYENIHAWLKANVAERPGYGVIDAADGYILLRRGAPVRPLPDAFFTFAQAAGPPQYAAAVDFAPAGAPPAIRFLGFDLLPRRDGEPFYALYFQALRPLDRDYAITLYLADERYQLRGASELPQMTLVWFPTSRWQSGATVRVVADTFTWWSGELEEFSVALGILDGEDVWDVGARLRPVVRDSELAPRLLGEGTLWHLMRFRAGARRPQPHPEPRDRLEGPLGTRVEARFGEAAKLLGVHVETSRVRPGETVRLSLAWEALADAPPSATVFVHLVDASGMVRGQQDNPPVWGTQPLSLWRVGDRVRDPYWIPVPADAPPGRYDLAIGLYDPTSGARLPVYGADGTHLGDHVHLVGAIELHR